MQSDRKLQIGLRVTQLLIALTILILTSFSRSRLGPVSSGDLVTNAWLVDQWTLHSSYYGKHAASPIGFLIFAPAFSFLTAVYLQFAPSVLPRTLHRFTPLLLILLNAIFYISGFIAMAVYLTSLNYCRGSVCDAARAACFLAAMAYVAYITEASVVGLNMIRSCRGSPLPLKDDYEDSDDREDHVGGIDHLDNYQRKRAEPGEMLSDVKL